MKLFKKVLFLVLILSLNISGTFALENSNLEYQGYVQNFGWLNPVNNDGLAGTVGMNNRLEAFQINSDLGTIHYTSHVANVGWQDEVTNGQLSGTTGQSLAIEAIKISLDENMSQNYDIYYHVHCANIGWLDWTSNGEIAGTTNLSIPVQAIEIQLVPKGTVFSESTERAYITSDDVSPYTNVSYQLHCANLGWQEPVQNGDTAGTIGEQRSAEAIKISAPDLKNFTSDSSIEYSVHGHNYGWQDKVQDGEVAGTEGEGLSIQAIKINLAGPIAQYCDVYYHVHTGNIGWLDWAKNGDEAGTVGFGLPIEAVEIKILPKNSTPPGETDEPFYSYDELYSYYVTVQPYVENIGWTDPVKGSDGAGTEGQCCGIEAIKMSVPNLHNDSGIAYNLMIEDIGWQGEYTNDQEAGTEGQNKQAEAFEVHLTGTMNTLFDVYYSAHCQEQGWMGWTKNGQPAGTYNGNKKLEAVKVMLIPKGGEGPNNGLDAFKEIQNKITANDVPNFNLICAIVQHESGGSYEGALAVMSCVMNRCDSGLWGGTDPVSVLTAPGQFASYLDGYYRQFLANPSPVVQQAVLDCLNGVRSHPYQSFRSYQTSGSVNIGGNWFF